MHHSPKAPLNTSARCQNTYQLNTIIQASVPFVPWRSYRLLPRRSQDFNQAANCFYYTCPMPEHSDVRSDKPGACPKCGMTEIPVMNAPPPVRPLGASQNFERNSNDQPAPDISGSKTLYTCPMKIHADVVSDKPGKCTKCEMDLVPYHPSSAWKARRRELAKTAAARPAIARWDQSES
jgi:hypothetical protein